MPHQEYLDVYVFVSHSLCANLVKVSHSKQAIYNIYLNYPLIAMANILVTGANRGIGYAIVQAIAASLPSSNIILACRKNQSAQEAIQSLRKEGITVSLDWIELDIEDDASIAAAAGALDQKYGSLDGMCFPSMTCEAASRVAN